MAAAEGVDHREHSVVWERVLEKTKAAQDKGSDPVLWVTELSWSLKSWGVSLPSAELAKLLVSHICWGNNEPVAWKFLDRAMAFNIVPPFLVLALLSVRVIPSRHSRPAAYRLYIELLRRHALTLKSHTDWPNLHKIIDLIDGVLHLSRTFGLRASEPGIFLVEFIFAIVFQLLDATLDDKGLLDRTPETIWLTRPQDMEVDGDDDDYNEQRIAHQEKLHDTNTMMAIELIRQFLQNKVTSRILKLAGHNMPAARWRAFVQRTELLAASSSALRNARVTASLQPGSNASEIPSRKCKAGSLQELHAISASGASCSALWLPLDLVLEDTMDGSQVNTTSAIEIIIGVFKALQAINNTTWHQSFLCLWMAALRLVQRERKPIEGPVPCLDTRLCMLLTIVTLVAADLVEEEESAPIDETSYNDSALCTEKPVPGTRRRDLASSLQSLGDYPSLLTPPQSVISIANQAAAKALMCTSGIDVAAYFERVDTNDIQMDCYGNMHHLIVEACIARDLLDTSAYFWPGYMNGRINQIPHNFLLQVPGWSALMEGASLTPVLIDVLVSVPASSLAELERVFEIAVGGSDDERIAAASILCGASLIRGWNIQEHTVHFIIRLLSPPVPVDHSGSGSHLIGYGPMLNVLLVGIAPVDCVQIFSLHGMVPQLAGALMPICEVFGSCVPDVSWPLPTGEEISVYAVFSNAFALLLKLWRFNHPPLEYRVGDVPPVGSQLTPEYLLLIRNSQLMARYRSKLSVSTASSSPKPIFLDSFPKLKLWYQQNQACLASTLSGLVPGTLVHDIVDDLLDMLFRKISRAGQSTSVTSGTSSSSGPAIENASLRLKLPAWDVLEALPFVVDAALTACAHGRLSPRELCTGLKDLADFLPASLATIVSYFSAEATRGVWKPVCMNGTDWPSPAANLLNVEQQIKRILAATGVAVPSVAAGGSFTAATLPLPLAAFVSVTITYKLDKASQRFLNLAGPALESLAAGCPWPCMPVVTSLWTQKAKRWSDFFVFSASQTVFLHNNKALVQLLKSCFTTTLGLKATLISSNGGVGALLGHGFGSHFSGGMSPAAPGILYLRVYRSIRDIMFLKEEIISLLMQSVRDIAHNGLPEDRLDELKKARSGMRYRKFSLAAAMAKVKVAASLGASLVWLSGGSALVQSMIIETLPSWFISEQEQGSDGVVAMLGGFALAYFAALCGALAWGVDSSSPASKRRSKVLRPHMEFMADAITGKISVGCRWATWRAYVLGFLSLVIAGSPSWVPELDVVLLGRLSKGLRQWNEEELALGLLRVGGVGTVGAAVQLIIESEI
ncbi:mediator of RNA polymerase II transcription subunit 33A-like [Diospyros lotus]|uniref:mediator of RNA polymerase II transcription subunit 33A-like n=1 Tax=Diospyros lotus TaxID=55363 RepID=UPI0022552CCC|nr:mediator of RNA polymerase II transcription subunit 33A-like [Diospyros lotus]